MGGPAKEAGGKNSLGQPTLTASSQAGPWAWVQELFWGLGESYSQEEGPLPPSSAPSLLPRGVRRSLPSLQRKEGRAGEGRPGKAGAGRAQAGPVL